MAKPGIRRVTAEISSDLHASLMAAKLLTGKPLSQLMREGLMFVARRAREQREAMRQAAATPSQDEIQQQEP